MNSTNFMSDRNLKSKHLGATGYRKWTWKNSYLSIFCHVVKDLL